MSFSSCEHKRVFTLMATEDRLVFEASNSFESFKLNLMYSLKCLDDFLSSVCHSLFV